MSDQKPFIPTAADVLVVSTALAARTELTPGAKLLYARMARYGAQSGECWAKQDRLAADIGVGERTVRAYIGELKDAGLITSVRRGLGLPNVYQFLRHPWLEEPARPEDSAGLTGEDSRSVAGDSAGPFLTSKEGSKELLAPRAKRAPQEKPRRLRAVKAEDNLPPSEDSRPRSTRVQRRSRSASMRRASDPAPSEDQRVSRTDRPASSKDLARYLRDTATAKWSFAQMGPAPFNLDALAGGIAQWRREGLSAEQVRRMIDVFCAESSPPTKTTLWRGFLAARTRLFEQTNKLTITQDAAGTFTDWQPRSGQEWG